MRNTKEIELVIRASSKKRRILYLLKREGYLYQANIAKMLDISNVTAREHLEKLVKLGLVFRSPTGKYIFYSLTEFGKLIYEEINH